MDLDRQARRRNGLPGRLGLRALERGDGQPHRGHRLADQGRRLEEHRQVVQNLLRSRAGKDRHQRTGLPALLGHEGRVGLLPGDLIEERMAYEGGAAAVLSEPRLFEGETAQHMVHQPPHLLHPPLGPGPDLRRRVVEHGNAVDLGPPGNPPVEAIADRGTISEVRCVHRLINHTRSRGSRLNMPKGRATVKAFKRRSLVSSFMLGMLAVTTVCGLMAGKAQAAAYYWDANANSPGAVKSNGTWGTSSFWTTSAAGTASSLQPTTSASDDLCFVASAGTSQRRKPYMVRLRDAGCRTITFNPPGPPRSQARARSASREAAGSPSRSMLTARRRKAALHLRPRSLQAAQSWTNNSSNPLTIGGNVLNGGNLLTIGGPGNTTVFGVISGSGGLSKTGSGT